jgi:hypothetical protein
LEVVAMRFFANYSLRHNIECHYNQYIGCNNILYNGTYEVVVCALADDWATPILSRSMSPFFGPEYLDDDVGHGLLISFIKPKLKIWVGTTHRSVLVVDSYIDIA